MATDKPRFSITMDPQMLEKVEDFQYENRMKSQSKAISELIRRGLAELENSQKTEKAPSEMDEADEIAKQYRELDSHGKGAVKAILNFESAAAIAEARQSAAPGRPALKMVKRSDGFIDLKVYDQPAAAGFGNYLDDPAYHMEQYPANVVPEAAEFGVRISGESMAPDIRNGSTVFVQSRASIEPGQIGIFVLNGDAFCKKLSVDREKGQVRLVSLNSAYEDRIIEECDDFRTVGLVLGQWSIGL